MAGESPLLIQPGASRKRIARALTAAYTGGLLSEDTYIQRVEALKAPLIDPFRLIGDLALRSRATGHAIRLFKAVDTATHRLRNRASGVEYRPVLLPLDWDGGERELFVGRHEDCDVVLSDPSVSRRHARLVFRDESWILVDLESTNGTLVNGERVTRCALRPGDRLMLGNEQLKID